MTHVFLALRRFFAVGWHWYQSINPPRTDTDCALLFHVCTDNQPPGKSLPQVTTDELAPDELVKLELKLNLDCVYGQLFS
jgi:hypothetical protein